MSCLQEVVLQQLQCKACFNYMKPPIRFCSKGHNACDSCVQKFTTCILCHYPFLSTRNKALEELSYEINLKCLTCDFSSNCIQMARHKETCHSHKIYKCYKEKVEENYLKKPCHWKGFIEEVFEHFKDYHEKSLYEVSLNTKSKFQWKLPYKQDQIDINVIHTEDGDFLHVVHYDDNKQKLHFAVMNIGMKKENFYFEIHINKGEETSKSERKVEEEYMSLKSLLSSKRYLTIPLSDFKNFSNKERFIEWDLIINRD